MTTFSEPLRKHIVKYGKIHQVLMAVEEMSELQKELLKNINRGMNNEEHIFEELVDVLFMTKQLQIIYDIDSVKLFDAVIRKEKEICDM